MGLIVVGVRKEQGKRKRGREGGREGGRESVHDVDRFTEAVVTTIILCVFSSRASVQAQSGCDALL